LSWTAKATNYILEAATTLKNPVWTAVSSNPQIIDNSNVVFLTNGAGGKFFRLNT
jgi:hypothetical protein